MTSPESEYTRQWFAQPRLNITAEKSYATSEVRKQKSIREPIYSVLELLYEQFCTLEETLDNAFEITFVFSLEIVGHKAEQIRLH